MQTVPMLAPFLTWGATVQKVKGCPGHTYAEGLSWNPSIVLLENISSFVMSQSERL